MRYELPDGYARYLLIGPSATRRPFRPVATSPLMLVAGGMAAICTQPESAALSRVRMMRLVATGPLLVPG